MKKEDGSLFNKLPALLFLLCVVILLISYGIRLRILDTTKNYLEDGVVSSNLSTLIINTDNYWNTGYFTTTGTFKNGELILESPEKSYDALIESIKTNLALNDDMQSTKPEMFDNFKIDTFIIYEVKYKKDVSNNVIHTKDDGTELEDNKYIEKITYDSTGNYTTTVLPYGTVKTPNGVNVSETTSYLKITFTVKNLFDKQNCKLEDAVQAVVKEMN